MIHSKPYDELAKIYDRVMNHVKYDKWAEYILSIFNYFGINVTNVLEIACGTGNLSVFLHRYGLNVTGMDLSLAMLKVAADKFKENNMPQKLFAADMTLLPIKKKFDAVLCLYDSLNYLKNIADFKKAVDEAQRITKDGGLFIFDVCTLLNSKIFFSDHSTFEELGDIKYERKCRFNDAESIQENTFIIEYDGKKFLEKHFQKIYKLDEICNIVTNSSGKETSFRLLGIFDDLTLNRGTENSERVHFVLQKK